MGKYYQGNKEACVLFLIKQSVLEQWLLKSEQVSRLIEHKAALE